MQERERETPRDYWVLSRDCVYCRKDKYEGKKLLWFWVDVAYEGEHKNADEEELTRTTEVGDALVKKVPLGLACASTSGGGPPPPGQESSDDEASGSSTNLEDASTDEPTSGSKKSPSSTKGKGKKLKRKGDSFHEEIPDEAHIMWYMSYNTWHLQ